MFGKEFLFSIYGIKKRIFNILRILKKIGNVLERILIYQKKYKKDKILYLRNINENQDCLGKKSFNHKRYQKDNILHLDNI
jgi:hypothetical protein